MQIILASAKIMNVSIKREQSKPICSVEREKRGMKSVGYGAKVILNYINYFTFLRGKVLLMQKIVYLCMVFHTCYRHFYHH